MTMTAPHPDLVRHVQDGTIPKGQVLLVGTDRGFEAVHLLERGYDVVGIDPDPDNIRSTRETVSYRGFFGYFQLGEPSALPVEDAYFDVVCDFLETPEPELKRVLRRGGKSFRFKR